MGSHQLRARAKAAAGTRTLTQTLRLGERRSRQPLLPLLKYRPRLPADRLAAVTPSQHHPYCFYKPEPPPPPSPFAVTVDLVDLFTVQPASPQPAGSESVLSYGVHALAILIYAALAQPLSAVSAGLRASCCSSPFYIIRPATAATATAQGPTQLECPTRPPPSG